MLDCYPGSMLNPNRILKLAIARDFPSELPVVQTNNWESTPELIPAKPHQCGRFIMGYRDSSANVPSTICTRSKREGRPFCKHCEDYVIFAFHYRLPAALVIELNQLRGV